MEAKHDADESTKVEIDGLLATTRGHQKGFAIDVADNNDERSPGLLVQGGPSGYKLDMWWDENDTRHQCNQWVRFGSDHSQQYPHDNKHDRDAELRTGNRKGSPAIIIHDPDPRAEAAGYDGADIVVQRHEDGLLVTLEWEDEYENLRHYAAVVPFADPRKEDQKGKYYDYMLPVSEDEIGAE